MTKKEILEYLEYSPSNCIKIGKYNDISVVIKVGTKDDGRPYALKYHETQEKAHSGSVVSWKTIFTMVMNREVKMEFEWAEIYTGMFTFGHQETEVRKIVRLYGKKNRNS